MVRLRLLLLLLMLMGTASLAAERSAAVRSPGGTVEVTLTVTGEGGLRYRVSDRGRPVLEESRLGFSLAQGPNLDSGFDWVSQSESEHRETWRPVYGERSTVLDAHREVRVAVRQRATGLQLVVVARAYDEGAAVRCEFPGPLPTGGLTLRREWTEFRFPAGTEGYEEHGTEGEYARVPVGAIRSGCEWPLTVVYADGRHACLLEAALVGYPRMRLGPLSLSPGALVTELHSPALIEAGGTRETPWRAIIVGDRPAHLLERNDLVLNLNAPCALADTSWIRPGKAIREITLSTPGGMACVDFAVAHGFSYILYDAGWYGHEYDDAADARAVNLDPKRVGGVPNHPGLDLPAVLAYAKSRGIGVFLYVNRRALERQLDELLPLYASWGVAGIKFGFVQVGPQKWTTWLHDAVRKAAEHRLMVDIHDGYRPSGFSRTYPNLLTQEGVRGNEHMPSATHNATLPFTRLPAGAADYTICVYSPRIKPTRAHQVALAVTGYSPLQLLYWYDEPRQFSGESELGFFDHVPTVWDETRVVADDIGRFVAIARRNGAAWYLGVITGDAAPRRERLALTFLSPGIRYTAEIHENGDPPATTRSRRLAVTADGGLDVSLPPAGGLAARFVPEN